MSWSPQGRSVHRQAFRKRALAYLRAEYGDLVAAHAEAHLRETNARDIVWAAREIGVGLVAKHAPAAADRYAEYHGFAPAE